MATRADVSFPSDEQRCDGWLYPRCAGRSWRGRRPLRLRHHFDQAHSDLAAATCGADVTKSHSGLDAGARASRPKASPRGPNAVLRCIWDLEVRTMSVEDQDPLADRFAAFRHDYPYRETSCRGMVWRYRAGGTADRPTVLVLPGATLVPDPLFVVVQALGRRHRVIAPAYPPAGTIADLVAGVIAVLDAERVATAHVVGSSFGGYVAQCLMRAHPERVDSLVLAQTGVRHFIGPVPMAVLRAVLRVAPAGLVRSFTWRTWQTLLADIGPAQQFWMAVLRDILDHQLTKAHLVAVVAAIGDFTGHHRPMPGDLEWKRPVLVLQSEYDRAFASQADEIRAVYPTAAFQVVAGAGHGALFTHTDQYLDLLQAFLADPVAFAAASQDPAMGTGT